MATGNGISLRWRCHWVPGPRACRPAMLGSILPASRSARGVFLVLRWGGGFHTGCGDAARCRDPGCGNCPGSSAASCQLLWAPEIAPARPPCSWAATGGHHLQLMGTGLLAPHMGPGRWGAWRHPRSRRKVRPTERCISQNQTAAEAMCNYLPPRRALIAAPVAGAASWQLSSGKSLLLPGRQVI